MYQTATQHQYKQVSHTRAIPRMHQHATTSKTKLQFNINDIINRHEELTQLQHTLQHSLPTPQHMRPTTRHKSTSVQETHNNRSNHTPVLADKLGRGLTELNKTYYI